MPDEVLDAAVARMKTRLLSAPYEICMARARYFTEVYRETEATVAAALAPPKRHVPESRAGGFFSVISDPAAYSALFYMVLSLLTGILFFTITVTGLSLSIGLSITIFGIFFFLLFVTVERALSLMEGRIVETLLGIRMPRRPPYIRKGRPLLQRLKEMVTDPRSWSTMGYMALMLPLGLVYFVIAIVGTVLSIALLLTPFALLLGPLGIPSDVELWMIPLTFGLGVVLAPSVLHLAKKIGKFHGALAKNLLVPPAAK